jgi:hypothetical protein
MKRKLGWFELLTLGFALVTLGTLTGCVGYVGDGYGSAVVVAEPHAYFYTGDYGWGRNAYGYGHRGYYSRSYGHGGGGRRGHR